MNLISLSQKLPKIKAEKCEEKSINNTLSLKIFALLVALAVWASIFKIELVFGIRFDLTSIVFILILLTFGRRKALSVAGIISIISILFFKEKYIFLLHLLEILTIDIIRKRYEQLSVIILTIIFWGILGIPILAIIYILTSKMSFNEYYLFDMMFIVLNCIFNAYVAEIIYIYVIKKYILKKSISITIKHIILHIITATILVPFMLNIFTDIFKTNEHISNNVHTYASDTFKYISDEIRTWDSKSITNLKLFGIVETSQLKDFISNYTKNKPFNVNVSTNINTRILSVNNYKKYIEDYNAYENIEVYNNELYKMVPVTNSRIVDTNWMDGFFIYERKIEGCDINISIEVPISIYKENILREYGSQFKFLILFVLFIGFIVMLLNRVIFNDLTKLAKNTESYKSFLYENNKETWPSTDILEVGYLVDNIKKMIDELKHSFKELKSSEEMLYELAYYDTLTNLPNRPYFRMRLEELVNSLEVNKKLCVMFLDLNRFKVINDSLGHDVGDKLLKKVAKRLDSLKSESLEIFRLGGDEFVILAKINERADIEEIGESVLNKFKEKFVLDDLILNISCSAGVSVYPDDSKNINSILQYADISMYKAKDKELEKVQLFDAKMKELVLEKLVIEKEIFNALENEEFTLYYQPKYSPINDEVKSLEALIRWSSEKLGVISPNKFISIAEESDLIFKIDKWVILNACKENKRLQDEGYKKIPVSVNISAKHFATEEIEKIILNALEISKLEPKYLIVEITEGVLIENFQVVERIIKNLNKKGVCISIDDFGTGYSSFNQLMKLPINEVKIDRAFVMNIENEERKASIVKSMIELAHRLDLNVVAEGVETNGEKEILKNIGCDEIQGYLYTKPTEFNEVKKFL
ncbi:MAG: putative bifunctional diguanylate cyclase/phosphodiesterase [Sarcina sp.]